MIKELLSCGNSVNAPRLMCGCEEEEVEVEEVEREGRLLLGITDYLLPKVGHHVQSLDLAYSRSVDSIMVSAVVYGAVHGCTVYITKYMYMYMKLSKNHNFLNTNVA